MAFGYVMNIFELSAIASPIAGAVAGGAAVRSPGVGLLVLGAVAGLCTGLALYFAAIGISGLLSRLCMAQKLNPLQWLASLTAVLLPAASPFAAYALSMLIVPGVLHI